MTSGYTHQAFYLCLIIVRLGLGRSSISPDSNALPGGSLDQRLIVLPEDFASKYNAKCLDGSSPAIYYAPAKNGFEENWVIYFKGGGWCFNEESCATRSLSILGTSSRLPQNLSSIWDKSAGPLHPNASMNPMFANFHRVLLWYCDGASFAGSVKNPIINTTGTGKNVTLWFRGQEVLNSQLNYLIEKFSLGKAENVLVTGCSAGGMATYLQADKVCKIVANPRLKKCKAAALSGFFLDHKNVYGIPKAHIQYEYIMRMQNMSGGVNQNCILKGASSCATPQQNYAFVTTPFFVMNSMLDLYQMENILEVGCKNLAQCNRSEISNIIEYQQDFRRTITSIKTLFKPGNGAFLDNCMIHCGEQDSTGFNNFAVPLADGGDRIVMRDALSKWWNATEGDLAENHIYIENCEIQGPQPCNPSCGSTYNV